MSRGDRKAILIGAMILVGSWLLFRVVPRLHSQWERTKERVEGQRQLLADTQLSLESLPRMEDSTRTLTAKVSSLAPRLLAGSTGSLAASDLSTRLSTLASLSHGRTLRVESRPDSASAGPLRRVTTLMAVETDFRGLTELLDRLSRDALVTVVERLQVTPADPLAAPTVVERLSVELRISAWYLERGSES